MIKISVHEIEARIIQNTQTDEAIQNQVLWSKCGKPNTRRFQYIRDHIKDQGWIKKVKGGYIRVDFSKEKFLSFKKDWIHDWAKDTRKIIANKHKPLFKKTKRGVDYLTKSAQEDLYLYFNQCDFHTLNVYNRNFLAFRLKLISPNEFERNNYEIGILFNSMFYGLINNHKSFKKQIIAHYMKSIHKTRFIV